MEPAAEISRFCVTQRDHARDDGKGAVRNSPWDHRVAGRFEAYDAIAVYAASLGAPQHQQQQAPAADTQSLPVLGAFTWGDAEYIISSIRLREEGTDPWRTPDPSRAQRVVEYLQSIYGHGLGEPAPPAAASPARTTSSASFTPAAFTPAAPGSNGTEPAAPAPVG